MMQRKALVIGCTGQDGSFLCDLLLKKGYEVHGIIRRSSSLNTGRIDHIFDRLHLHFGDLADGSSLNKILHDTRPEEIYALGAQSHVRVSFDCPEYTCDVDAMGTLRLLEAMKANCPEARLYQASSSEMFGKVQEVPQSEQTQFYPRSPYGVAKCFSYWIVKNYREGHHLFASNGVLFNHESERRGETFVSRKITKAAARISKGLQKELLLGNLDARRDFGYAPEYVEAMWRILQHSEPDDFVIATGETHSIREFLDEAFGYVGLDWKQYVGIDEKYYRPTEVDLLIGDPSKAKRLLGWEPRVRFKELVRIMMKSELEGLRHELTK